MFKANDVMHSFLLALQSTALATAIREGQSLFPWIESVHVLATTLVIGSIALVDLRLLGMGLGDRSVGQVTALAIPVTWSSFGLAVVSGGLLFSSNASNYADNPFLRAKLILIVLAGVNMLVYHAFVGTKASHWITAAQTPLRARAAGGVSLCLWVAIAACGRWIGFSLNTPG